MRREIQILENAEALSRRAAGYFRLEAVQAVQAKGSFFVALSGGATPRGFYSVLATDPVLREGVPWEHCQFFWGDERHVGPDNPQSNYRGAFETLLSRVPVPPANIHRIRGELANARQAAEEYEFTLRHCFALGAGDIPRFDLVWLGLGADGHTASLFPGTEALAEQERSVAANWVEQLHTWRITLTLPVLNQAAGVVFLVSGADKAEVLKEVLENPSAGAPYPAQQVQPIEGKVLWLVDQAAAQFIHA